MSPAAIESVREKLRTIQTTVREKTGVEMTEEQILDVHIRALEPRPLTNAIVFALTLDPIDHEKEEQP